MKECSSHRTVVLAFVLALLPLLGLRLCAQTPAERAGVDLFENRIRPLFVEHCYECHSAKAKKVRGGLRLDSRDDLMKGGDSGFAIVPGDPERSLLIKAVRYAEKDLAMPPSKDGSKKLPDIAIADLVTWVKNGATYPVSEISDAKSRIPKALHWSFQPIQNPPEPAVQNTSWPRNSLDRFILAKLEAQGRQPAPAANRRTLIRRATFDLTGLPPTPEEIDAFLADSSVDAFATIVDRLLSSPRYGERWGRHWLDIVRYADTAGDTADFPVPEAWRYRNYVINAFNTDKPYDEFLREQIAGDILAREGPREHYAERVTATGYLAMSRRFGFDSENYQHLTIQDTIDTVGQSVLGLTLGCARCHNHKFDPVTSTEYYGLYGIFDSTRYAFPGSEQKQKYRALAPLVPVEESQARWREFNERFAAEGVNPGAVLRPLDGIDGDFEMQHVASGGSKGVLVQPWFYEGRIAVTQEAQSVFKHLYPFGSVGVSVPAGHDGYWIKQSLHPDRAHGLVYVNLDFRAETNNSAGRGQHRFWIGSRDASPAVEVLISPVALSLLAGERQEVIPLPRPGQWNNVQLTLDLDRRTVSGTVGVPGEVTGFANIPFTKTWTGLINFVAIDSHGPSRDRRPALHLDNVGVQASPIPPVSTSAISAVGSAQNPNLPMLQAQLDALTGIDGDFELQKDGAPPATPWRAGPKSVAKISAASQSPFRNVHPPGNLGIHMPNSGGYNGFGQTLTKPWKAPATERLLVGFDFRCSSAESGGSGSWRYYLGHGAGTSAAVEIFFNVSEFFRLSGATREAVQPLLANEWYQVQLALNLKEKSYTGTLGSESGRTEFAGQFASGWDGTIDYTFIDSNGHVGGVKPALDADNFVIGETSLPSLAAPPVERTEDRGARLAKIDGLRRQLDQLTAMAEKRKQDLNRLLAEGPLELSYGVTEGTPHNARLQPRGEPDNPGEEVPRAFLKVLGGGTVPPGGSGSGRRELAQWLTSPANPLPARVMVNRLWQYHFGQGLVKTPNDFGMRGQRPSHPELLDHFATRFIRGGWSIKAMHRLIMLSASYQQGNACSVSNDQNELVYSGAKARSSTTDCFSPFDRRRLDAEELRDSILFISGELDPAPGQSHPFPAATSWGYTQHAPFNAVYDHRQRSVYLMTQRLKRHPFLALFDGPDPNSSTPDRRVTTVPTQALYFLNDPFVHAQSEKFAARLRRLGPDETRRIKHAYLLAFGRWPSQTERAEAVEFLQAYRSELPVAKQDGTDTTALAAFARVLFGSNEFLMID